MPRFAHLTPDSSELARRPECPASLPLLREGVEDDRPLRSGGRIQAQVVVSLGDERA